MTADHARLATQMRLAIAMLLASADDVHAGLYSAAELRNLAEGLAHLVAALRNGSVTESVDADSPAVIQGERLEVDPQRHREEDRMS